jgi:hypothetical protein
MSAETQVLTGEMTGQMVVKSCGCQSKWCPKCRTHHLLDWATAAAEQISKIGGEWISLVLTLNRDRFPDGPRQAYEELCDKRAVGQFVQTLRRHEIITGRGVGFLEWQDGLWAHWHLVVQLGPHAAESLNAAYRARRGQGVINWKDEHVAPAWQHGFSSVQIIRNLEKQLSYACAYGAKDKGHQLDLPKWAPEFLAENNRKSIPKLWASRGKQSFWLANESGSPSSIAGGDAVAEDERIGDKDAPDDEPVKPAKERRPVTVIVENCGKERSVIGREVAKSGYTCGEWFAGIGIGGDELMRLFFEAGGQAEVLNAKGGRWRIAPAELHILGQVITNARAELCRFSMNDVEEDEAGLWWSRRLGWDASRYVAQDGSAF